MVKEIKFFTPIREKIVKEIIRKPQDITSLSEVTRLGRTTIYHHIMILNSKGLIKEKVLEKTHGNPVLLHFIIPKKIQKIILEIINHLESFRKKWGSLKPDKAPSKVSKEDIKNLIDCSEEDFEVAYGILEIYKAIGIIVTKQGLELKKELLKKTQNETKKIK